MSLWVTSTQKQKMNTLLRINMKLKINMKLLHWLIKVNGRFSPKTSLTLIWVGFLGVHFEVVRVKITPHPDDDDELFLWMNYFCGIVDQWKALSLISSQDHCQRSSPSQAGFEPAWNLNSGFAEWSCAVVITTTPRCPSI